ncbi:MAG TPA: TolC family protein [Deinococcales bacterium]|nr:TolC family protein [Deinococcales bacterium]
MKQPVKPAVVLSRTAVVAITLGLSSAAFAATSASAPLTFTAAWAQAQAKAPDILSATSNLAQAQADLTAAQADPTTLITALTNAQNAVNLDKVNLQAAKISVFSNLLTAYVNLYEAQQNLDLLQANVDLSQKNLDVAKAKLAAKAATSLDVAKAQNALASSQQNLADARAQVPILSDRLSPLLGLGTAQNLSVAEPPSLSVKAVDLAALEAGLARNLSNVLQAQQSVEVAKLNVTLADNDYTPAATLASAQTQLAAAQRSLQSATTNAVTSLRDSHRAYKNALQQQALKRQDRVNAEEALTQAQARLKAGQISRVDLQTSQVNALQARYAELQANDSVSKSLAALCSAAGQDLTGMVK